MKTTEESTAIIELKARNWELRLACESLVEFWNNWAKDSCFIQEPLRRSLEMRAEQAQSALDFDPIPTGHTRDDLIPPSGTQIVSKKAIGWLHANHPQIYAEFYNRL